jgi:hypothetical protein
MIEVMLELGLSFWILSFLAFVALIAFVENKLGGWAIATVILYLALIHFFSTRGWTPVNILEYAQAHWGEVFVGIASYFVVGTAWSILKWWSFVRGERRKYDEVLSAKTESLGRPMSQWTDQEKKEFNDSFSYRYGEERVEIHPMVAKHKEDVFLWIGFWPFSATWTIIDDPVRRICKAIYDMISKQLQAISDHAWEGAEPPPKKFDKNTPLDN